MRNRLFASERGVNILSANTNTTVGGLFKRLGAIFLDDPGFDILPEAYVYQFCLHPPLFRSVIVFFGKVAGKP